MWTNLIEKIPEDQLATWSSWLTNLSILLPILGAILGGFCVWMGSKISDRVLNNARQAAERAQVMATKLEEKQSPWKLTEEQEDKFCAYLKNATKGKVAIEYISSDGKRSHDFAVEIKNMLEAAGYEVWSYMPAFQQASGVPLVGVQIQIKDQQSDTVGGYIQRAFKAIGIEAGGVHRTNNNYADDFVVILIGIKP